MKDQHALDLGDKLMTLDTKQRIHGDNALNHDFFGSTPCHDLIWPLVKNRHGYWSEFLVAGCPSSHQPAQIREETLESGNLFRGIIIIIIMSLMTF